MVAFSVLFAPAAADGRELPLVFDLHGSGGNGESQAHSSRLADVGAKNGFAAANPNGGVTNFPPHRRSITGTFRVCHSPGVGDTPADAPDDVQFISDSIDQIAAQTGKSRSEPHLCDWHVRRGAHGISIRVVGCQPYCRDRTSSWVCARAYHRPTIRRAGSLVLAGRHGRCPSSAFMATW